MGSPITRINTIDEYGRATLHIAAIKVNECKTVSTGKVKQELTVADTTGSTILTLWEDNTHCLEEGKSYQLNRFQVHTYFGKYP